MWLPPPIEALSRRVLPDPGRRAVALKAMSFARVGVVNALVDLGVFSLFHFYLGISIIVSNLISWLVAVSGSYVMNSMTTFAAESGRKLRFESYASFLLAEIAGLVANTAKIFIVSYFVPVLWHVVFGADAALAIGGYDIDPVLIGKLFAIGSSFLVNFSLSHFVVFRHADSPRLIETFGRRRVLHDENLRAERGSFVTHLECALPIGSTGSSDLSRPHLQIGPKSCRVI
jgi:putative flippase GtrA